MCRVSERLRWSRIHYVYIESCAAWGSKGSGSRLAFGISAAWPLAPSAVSDASIKYLQDRLCSNYCPLTTASIMTANACQLCPGLAFPEAPTGRYQLEGFHVHSDLIGSSASMTVLLIHPRIGICGTADGGGMNRISCTVRSVGSMTPPVGIRCCCLRLACASTTLCCRSFSDRFRSLPPAAALLPAVSCHAVASSVGR